MIRTRCPHCNKLLGIVDAAAGKVTTCPGCQQKFRAPAAAKAPPAENFPEVEVVDDAGAAAPAAAAPRQRPASRKPDPDEDVASRDDEEDTPVRKAGGKKKKGKRPIKSANMAVRNRIMGAVGAAGGLFLIIFGVLNQEILNVTARARAYNPSLESVPRFATIAFGALLVLVGGYYLIIDLVRKS